MAHACPPLAIALVLLVTLPGVGRAAPFALEAGWLNSTLTFGGATFQDDGYDVGAVSVSDLEVVPPGCCTGNVFFNASGGALVSETSSGADTEWRYEGGTFAVRFGSDPAFFTAPIVSLVISTGDPVGPDASLTVRYELADGLFDAPFAALYGIPTHTGSGRVFESLRVFERDAETGVLRADDGGAVLEVDAAEVPEPALNLLLGLGLTATALYWRINAS
jgi:hypothetical protein